MTAQLVGAWRPVAARVEPGHCLAAQVLTQHGARECQPGLPVALIAVR